MEQTAEIHTTKFSQIVQAKNRQQIKLRKGRVALIISFVIFLTLDIFLITEYKAVGINSSGYQLMKKVGAMFESGRNLISSIWEPELKQDENLTSLLIVGIDTRDVKFTGDEFVSTNPDGLTGHRNTDTIIQIVYNHTNSNIFTISIPRDTGIDINKECLNFHGSVHWVYDKGQSANCPGGGVQTLTETVEDITGVKVHYYAFISLDVFIDIINTIGEANEEGEQGIWLDVPAPVYELYPLEDKGWESIYFPAGYQFMTAERTLKFARSRQNSSDFSRARRQQLVIESVKNRIMSSDTLADPQKLYSLIQTFSENALFTKPDLEEIQAALYIARDLDTSEIINIVLDPEIGGHETYINRRPHDKPGGPYYMVPTHWKECAEREKSEFCEVQTFIRQILAYPTVYQEQAKIFVYAQNYDSSYQANFDNYKYQTFKKKQIPVRLEESKYIANLDTKNNITILDFSDGSKTKTLKLLTEEFNVNITSGSEAANIRINNEDIAIVIQGE